MTLKETLDAVDLAERTLEGKLNSVIRETLHEFVDMGGVFPKNIELMYTTSAFGKEYEPNVHIRIKL